MRYKIFALSFFIIFLFSFLPVGAQTSNTTQGIGTKSLIKISLPVSSQLQNANFIILQDSLKLPIKLVEVRLDGQAKWLKETNDVQKAGTVKNVVYWNFDPKTRQLVLNLGGIKSQLLPNRQLVIKIAPINRQKEMSRILIFTAPNAQPTSQNLPQEYRNVNVEIQ